MKLLTLLALLLLPLALTAQDDLFGGNDELDNFTLEEEPVRDYEKLPGTYLSELAYWPYVAVVHKSWRSDEQRYDWEQVTVSGLGDRLFVRPMSERPLVNLADVPEAASYRVWLGYIAETKAVHPVTVSFSGANTWEHTYGKQLPNEGGEAIERKLPLRFDSEIGRMAAQIKPVAVWEYADVELQPGTTRIEIEALADTARLDAIVITRSKTFVPSKSQVDDEANLNKIYYRYKYTDPDDQALERIYFDSFVRYVWAHYKPGSTEMIWYSSMKPITSVDGGTYVQVGEWSDWTEVSAQVTNGGRYLTDRMSVRKEGRALVEGGTLHVQHAWFPDEGAVLKSLEMPIFEGSSTYLVPVARRGGGYKTPATEADATSGVWSTRDAEYLSWFLTERGAVERLMRDIEREVDLSDIAGELPWRIRLYTTCRTNPAAYDVAIPLLKRFGINWIPHLSLADKQKYGLHIEDALNQQSGTIAVHSHDPLDPLYDDALLRQHYGTEALAARVEEDPEYTSRQHWLKMGDEIGKVTSATHINGLPDCRRAYIDYMQRAAEAAGSDASFFGVESYDDLWYHLDSRPDMTLPERRQYYHNKRFIWWFTAMFYKRHSDIARTHMPQLLTRTNYTPAGPMFAGDMGYSNWFALPRYGASTAHMSEDWLSAGGGYTSQAGVQTISFYGALMKAAVLPDPLPMDFIMVGRTGGLDRKLPSLVGSGIYSIYVYDWGPEYTRGAVDTWSHVFRTYEQLGTGARAVGAAEDILIDGTPDPARVALLYNRTNEILHGGAYGVFSDRLYTWIALRQAHLPVDLILEDDLTPELLSRYDVLYANGFNIRRATIAPLRQWVEAGGTLVASGGFAHGDEYDEPITELAELLGVTQRFGKVSKGARWMPFYIPDHEPYGTVTMQDSPLTEAMSGGAIGLQSILTPTSATPVATYDDGTVAAAYRTAGEGHVLTFGFQPGLFFAANAPRDDNGQPTTYSHDRRRLNALPALRQAPAPTATYSEPLSELYVRTTDDAIAIILVDYSYAPGTPATLTVRTDRDISEVTGTLTGPLDFTRNGDHILITCPIPDPTNVILLR